MWLILLLWIVIALPQVIVFYHVIFWSILCFILLFSDLSCDLIIKVRAIMSSSWVNLESGVAVKKFCAHHVQARFAWIFANVFSWTHLLEMFYHFFTPDIWANCVGLQWLAYIWNFNIKLRKNQYQPIYKVSNHYDTLRFGKKPGSYSLNAYFLFYLK